MSDRYQEICEHAPPNAIVALINGDRGWLMYLDEPGDSGYSSRNPAYDGPPDALIEYYLSNGQRDEYPASWAFPVEDIHRALEHFRRTGERAPFIVWHRD